jgi:putative DNA primase/helicase
VTPTHDAPQGHQPRRLPSYHLRDFRQRKPPEDQQTEFLIFPSVWTGEVCKGHDPAAVARLLIKRGALKPAEDNRPARSLTLPGEGKRRVYHVTPALWAGEQ